jgi:hypothetical protein
MADTPDTSAEDLAREIAAAIAGEDSTTSEAVTTTEASSLNTKSGSGI